MFSSHNRTKRHLAITVVLPLGLLLAAVSTVGASVADHDPQGGKAPVYTVHQIFSGTTLTHSFTPAGANASVTAKLSNPDDITQLGNDLFVGFQNGVGPQGEASTTGNLDSTIVELQRNGDPVAQWDIQGKADGVTADPTTGDVIATVNEDANSSLYTINPSASSVVNQVTHYNYSEPLPHNGGSDAISILNGQILISASAPGTSGPAAPSPVYPAVYTVSLNATTHVAKVDALFGDEDTATVANVGDPQFGKSIALALTDPDSSEIVPAGARFGGDYMLTSQGDQEQIYVSDAGAHNQSLNVLALSQSVDDTAWPTSSSGKLYSTDTTNDAVDTVAGPFSPKEPFVVATPCGSNGAPAICPAPKFPSNYLATLDPTTGVVSAVTTEGAAYAPQGGLIFVAQNPNSSRGANKH